MPTGLPGVALAGSRLLSGVSNITAGFIQGTTGSIPFLKDVATIDGNVTGLTINKLK